MGTSWAHGRSFWGTVLQVVALSSPASCSSMAIQCTAGLHFHFAVVAQLLTGAVSVDTMLGYEHQIEEGEGKLEFGRMVEERLEQEVLLHQIQHALHRSACLSHIARRSAHTLYWVHSGPNTRLLGWAVLLPLPFFVGSTSMSLVESGSSLLTRC